MSFEDWYYAVGKFTVLGVGSVGAILLLLYCFLSMAEKSLKRAGLFWDFISFCALRHRIRKLQLTSGEFAKALEDVVLRERHLKENRESASQGRPPVARTRD